MLKPDKIAEVETLLRPGLLSHHEISRRTGISRPSVTRIAKGTVSARSRERDEPELPAMSPADFLAIYDGAQKGVQEKLKQKRKRLADEAGDRSPRINHAQKVNL